MLYCKSVDGNLCSKNHYKEFLSSTALIYLLLIHENVTFYVNHLQHGGAGKSQNSNCYACPCIIETLAINGIYNMRLCYCKSVDGNFGSKNHYKNFLLSTA